MTSTLPSLPQPLTRTALLLAISERGGLLFLCRKLLLCAPARCFVRQPGSPGLIPRWPTRLQPALAK